MATLTVSEYCSFGNTPIVRMDVLERVGTTPSSAVLTCITTGAPIEREAILEYGVLMSGGSGRVIWNGAKRGDIEVVGRTDVAETRVRFIVDDARWKWRHIQYSESFNTGSDGTGAISAATIYERVLDAGGIPHVAANEMPPALQGLYPSVDLTGTVKDALDQLSEATGSTVARGLDGRIHVYMWGEPALGGAAPAVDGRRAHDVSKDTETVPEYVEIIGGPTLYEMVCGLRMVVTVPEIDNANSSDRLKIYVVDAEKADIGDLKDIHPWIAGPINTGGQRPQTLEEAGIIGKSLFRLYQCSKFTQVPTTVVDGSPGNMVGPPEVGDITAQETLTRVTQTVASMAQKDTVLRSAKMSPYVFGHFLPWEMLAFWSRQQDRGWYSGDYRFDTELAAFWFELPVYSVKNTAYPEHTAARMFGRIACTVKLDGQVIRARYRKNLGGTGPPVVIEKPEAQLIFRHKNDPRVSDQLAYPPEPKNRWEVDKSSLSVFDSLAMKEGGGPDGKYQIEMAGLVWYEITGSVRAARYIAGDNLEPRTILGVNQMVEA